MQCISSSTYWLLFYLWNYGHLPTLRATFTKILEKAKAMMVEEGKLGQVEGSKAIPAINLRRAVPRLPGQDVSAYDSYTGEIQEGRRVLQLEIDDTEADRLDPIIDYVKKKRLHTKMLGK